MSENDPTSDVATLTVQLLSAYLANNTVASDDLADLIRSTRAALTEDAAAAAAQPVPETFTPAVSVRKSLASSAHIISLIDGKSYKTLKRHLASHGLTPDTYRSRYNLPPSYPMVAPDYAAHRRAVAQKIGLGSRKPATESRDESDLGSAIQDAQDTPELESTETAANPAPSGSKASRRKSGDKPAARAKSSGAGATAAGTEAASPPSESAGEQTDTPSKRKYKPRAGKAADPASETTQADSTDAVPSGASDAAPPASEDGNPAPDTGAPKRRGRKGASASATEQDAVTADDASGTGGEEKPTTKSTRKTSAAKAKKPPRMARAPKSGSASDGDTTG